MSWAHVFTPCRKSPTETHCPSELAHWRRYWLVLVTCLMPTHTKRGKAWWENGMHIELVNLSGTCWTKHLNTIDGFGGGGSLEWELWFWLFFWLQVVLWVVVAQERVVRVCGCNLIEETCKCKQQRAKKLPIPNYLLVTMNTGTCKFIFIKIIYGHLKIISR